MAYKEQTDGNSSKYKEEVKDSKEYVLETRIDEKGREEQKLPQFKDIFYDLPISGTIAGYCTYYNGVIYFPCLDTHVYAVDASSGLLIWKFKTGGPIAWSVPLIHNNKIYFGSSDEHFYCLDLSGKLIWKKHLGNIIISAPVGIGDKIFIGNGAGYFFCFSEDGRELWKFKTGDGIVAIPSFINGKIFIGSYDKHVYALDYETGRMIWKFRAGERIGSPLVMQNGKTIVSNHKRSFIEMPKASNPVLYCPSYDNYLYALDENGKELWMFNCNSSVPGGIGGDDGIVFAGTVSGRVYAVDSQTGKEKWNFLTGGMVTGGAELINGKVYITSFDQKIRCLTEDGKNIWEFLTGGPIAPRVLVVGNKLYIGSADSFLYCINIEKRSVEWTFQVSLAPSAMFVKKVDYFINAFSEYDKKIFKVWVPETSKGKNQTAGSLTGYGLPEGFSFGGEEVYKSSGAYKTGDLSYFGKKKPYKR